MDIGFYTDELFKENRPANFGSDVMFNYIKQSLADGLLRENWAPIHETIKRYCYYVSRKKGLSEDNITDIVSKVDFKVYEKITKFVLDSEYNSYSEVQRTSWLKTIIESKISDFKRKPCNIYETSFNVGTADDEIDDDKNSLYIDDSEQQTQVFERLEKREELMNAFRYVFSLNTTSDKIISFLYNICLAELGKYSHKNKLSRISDELYGKPKKSILKELKDILYDCFEFPDHIYKSIEEKTEKEIKAGKELYERTPDQIRSDSDWVKKKLLQMKRD